MPFFHQNNERVLVYVNNDSGSETLIQGDLRGHLKQDRVKRNMPVKSSHPSSPATEVSPLKSYSSATDLANWTSCLNTSHRQGTLPLAEPDSHNEPPPRDHDHGLTDSQLIRSASSAKTPRTPYTTYNAHDSSNGFPTLFEHSKRQPTLKESSPRTSWSGASTKFFPSSSRASLYDW